MRPFLNGNCSGNMKAISKVILFILSVFIAPALASVGVWALGDHPNSWRSADWSSAGVLPQASADNGAAIYIMSARTGGLKGALATHSWIVIKAQNATNYNRYDKVGWGSPIRKNAYDADGRWYSNTPQIVRAIHGQKAETLIPKLKAAIADYPFAQSGDYRIWPGPNSNTFIAHILRQVPELGAILPVEAVGRDFPSDGKLVWRSADGREFRISLWGYAGLSFGLRTGFEINLAGLVAGFDVMRPALKIPGFGRIGMPAT
jgi:Protein of unknown function (DUF3750)